MQRARAAVESIASLSDADDRLWQAPFAAQMAYHGGGGEFLHKLHIWLSPDNSQFIKTTTTTHLPLMILYGVEDLRARIGQQEDVSAKDFFCGTALYAAVLKGNEQVISMLLDAGADVNVTGGIFHSVLQLASAQGSTTRMNLLLQAGANVNEVGGKYGTALTAAVCYGHRDALELLLAYGANPNLQATSGGRVVSSAPLLIAAESGNIDLVNRLLEIPGIDLDIRDYRSNNTPLRHALNCGHDAVAKCLASNQRMDKQAALFDAASFGNLNLVRFLIEQIGVPPDSADEQGFSALHFALQSNSDETATYLLTKCTLHDVNIRLSCGSAVAQAAGQGLENAVRILLERGADISPDPENGLTPIYFAASSGHARVVKLLLDHGADPTVPPEKPPLLVAASRGHAGVIAVLLEHPGVDADFQTRNGRATLVQAAHSGNYEAVRLLLESGSQVSAQTDHGSSALCSAAMSGSDDVVRLLLSHGAQLDIESAALGRTVNFEHLSTAEILISNGVNVNAPDIGGSAPLYMAVRQRYEEMVRLLLQSEDIDLNLRDPESGLTPLELAQQRDYPEIVALLVAWAARYPVRRLEYQNLPIIEKSRL